MPEISYTRENPSPRFRMLEELYRRVHASGLPDEGISAEKLFAGRNLLDHVPRVKALVKATGARSVLDYGSGKGLLYRMTDLAMPDGSIARDMKDYWGVETIRCYDPGVPQFAEPPSAPCDGVVCTDVLEHIPEEDVDWLLAELFRLASRFVYANIAAYPAGKTLPNGWNAHITVRPPQWWAERISKAAEGWGGQTYEFQVKERGSPVGRLARRLIGLNKWRTTSVSFTRATGASGTA
jgi:hypothetical protein